jgi:hypothetical protein
MIQPDEAPDDPIPYVSMSDASLQDHSTADRQFPGLHNDCSWIWAMIDTEDGTRYELIRCVSASGTFDFTLHECSTDLWKHPKLVRFPGERDMYWGQILWYEKDGKQTFLPANMTLAGAHPISIAIGPERIEWKDGDIVDVALTPLPRNVTRIYVPGLPDDLGYSSSGCTVSGTIAGQAITGGYGGIDRMYCLPGMSCLVSKIVALEHYWFVWASLMDDGSWQTGNAMLGTGKYATATFRNPDGAVIATNEECAPRSYGNSKRGLRNPCAQRSPSATVRSTSKPPTTRPRQACRWESLGCTERFKNAADPCP